MRIFFILKNRYADKKNYLSSKLRYFPNFLFFYPKFYFIPILKDKSKKNFKEYPPN